MGSDPVCRPLGVLLPEPGVDLDDVSDTDRVPLRAAADGARADGYLVFDGLRIKHHVWLHEPATELPELGPAVYQSQLHALVIRGPLGACADCPHVDTPRVVPETEHDYSFPLLYDRSISLVTVRTRRFWPSLALQTRRGGPPLL